MDRLYKYLENIGVQETTRHARPEDESPATYRRETFGDSNYFTNATNFIYSGAVVTLDYNVEAPANYFIKLRHIEKRLAAYCKKYGYIMQDRSAYFTRCFYIWRAEDRERALDYFSFRDNCIEECNQAAHKLYEAGKPEEVEKTLTEIMNLYGNAYNDFLKATETKTA